MYMNKKPYIEILEQPASKEFRFRYECERRLHGSIPGVHSTLLRKTYPKIKIIGLDTDAYVIVSCVTKEAPYKVHPHRLVSKDKGSNHGVFATTVRPDDNEIELKNIGIQCVRKRDVKKSLDERKEIRVDPFQQGYDHSEDPASIDLNVVRLCFQVFLFDRTTEKCTRKLTPVVSDPIYDKQTATNLKISKLSAKVASTAGGTSLIISGHKVIEEDVKIRFFEMKKDQVVWAALKDPLPRNNHDDQTTISVITPTYTRRDTESPVRVMIQLTKPSTGEAGKAIPFILLPPACFKNAGVNATMDLSSKRKRPVFDSCESLQVSNIPSCSQCPAPNQPESPDTNDPGSIVPKQEIVLYNIPQERQYFYYNRNLDTGGFAMHRHKRPKYFEDPLFPMTPRASPDPTMYPSLIANPNMCPMMLNNPEYPCQCFPPLPPSCNQFLPFMSQSSPCMRQYPVCGSTLPRIKDRHQVPVHDQRNRHAQPKPISSPDYVVKVDIKEVQPPISFDVNPNDHLHGSGNIMDLDLDRYIDSLSGTLSDIKLNGEDSILVICDNEKDGHGQVEPLLDPIIVKWSPHEMKSLKDYDYNTRNILDKNQNLMDFDFLSNIEIEKENNCSSEEPRDSQENEKKSSTEENLSLVCDNTIKEILKISKQQNLVQNNV
ncbi:proto-oncogene c-Rel [Diachasma alloeum]|uniref:proto-oncogene c-Rel n=1 Tax=Diachasma alloeum TaxID=454923 RepID=UPI0007383D45|nr:proto-oncogene c-Rel [Diachasma alloeum]